MLTANRTTNLVTRIRSASATILELTARHEALGAEVAALDFPNSSDDAHFEAGATKADVAAALVVLTALSSAVTPEARAALFRVLG